MPKEGTNLWVDAMVIPKNADNPLLAHAYIDFILAYENSRSNSLYVGYTSSNEEVLEELSAEGGEFAGNAAYLPRSDYELDELFHYNEQARKIMSELWTKAKIAK